VADDADLPFADGSFDLVVSRHPTVVLWREIARVLRPGGTYLAQQIGDGTVHELTDYMMGPQPASDSRSAKRARADAAAAGLSIVDLRYESLRMEFFDIAAVVHFLRKVIWIVPGFTVEKYRDRLEALHEQIQSDGPFIAHATRMLVEATKR
jgi:SAM-dependent methyltransferase